MTVMPHRKMDVTDALHKEMPSLKQKTIEAHKGTEGFIFDEKAHLYFLDGKPMTGCTTILGVIAKPALVGWAARMATEYLDGFIREAAEHADWPEMFASGRWDELVKEATAAHTKKRDKGASEGTNTHALVEEYVNICIENFNGKPLAESRDYDSIAGFTTWAKKENIRFIASEKLLYSKELWVAGTADLIFEKDGKTYIGDIKTYKKIWDRVPFFQCAGYALMWEEMHLRDWVEDTTGKKQPKIDGYCIINLPKERAFKESEDIKWSYDVEGDTNAFRAAVTLYRTLENW